MARPEGFEPPTTWFVDCRSDARKYLMANNFQVGSASRICATSADV